MDQGRCSVRVRSGPGKSAPEGAREWAQRFADLAVLSAIVYRDIENNHPPPQGWVQAPDGMDDPGTSLYFEVWDKVAANPVEVAVVFRGTHEWKDWWSNLRWVTRFIPIGWDQYDLVRAQIGNVVARARQRHADAVIVTAGHSLGGGLAQQAAYAHPEIKHVVAFDPSPVTGFREVPEPARTTNRQGIRIDRAYERGEILAYLRQFLTTLIPLSIGDPKIVEIRFNLMEGDPVRQHSMVDLATRMVLAAAEC